MLIHKAGQSLANRFEGTSRPGLVLLIVTFALYAPSLMDGFILDDHRAMRMLREHRAGERTSPDVYRFLSGRPEENRAEREEGWYPWWMADDLKYRHMRPLAEQMLLGEYRLFGERALGYRIVSLVAYAAGVLLALRFMRMVCEDERQARWAALVFAVSSAHAVPALFISSQPDVVALVCAAGAALAVGQYLQRGSLAFLALFMALFAVGLGMKEAVLPIAAAPLLLWLLWRSRPDAGRRAALGTLMSSVVSLAWLALYQQGGYGSNASIMLDPVRDPWGYLQAAPARAIQLLGAWVVSVNPFLFDCDAGLRGYGPYFTWFSVAIVLAMFAMYWRQHRHSRNIAIMAAWAIMFLPILVCTPADNRVMMLPSMALAVLAAAWLVRPGGSGPPRLRRLPLVLFILMPVATVLLTSWLLAYMEKEAQSHLRIMTAAFNRSPGDDDHIFVVNNRYLFEGLFMQDRLRSMREAGSCGANILCDIGDPKATAADRHTLRLEARSTPMMTSFLGRMAMRRDRPLRSGDVLTGSRFEGRVIDADSGGVRAVELKFHGPLSSDQYRFFITGDDGTPVRLRFED